ncbi:MAG: hypothetical protein ACI4Q3_03720 [Kiritimatiellia bacterium]
MGRPFTFAWPVAGLAAALVTTLPCAAADGTWISTTTGGDWNDTANWEDGVLPGDGGVATFDFSGQTNSILLSGDVAVELSELRVSSRTVADDNIELYLRGPKVTLVPPARIVRSGASLNVSSETFVCTGDLTVEGLGRTILNGSQALGGRLVLKDLGWVRAVTDESLGSTPETLVPDAIVLDGGILQNGGDTTLAATRGITLTEKGGGLTAGYPKPAKLTVSGPITGPGDLRICYENSPVMLSNPANDWTGDTNVGMCDTCVTAYSDWFSLLLGADEVIPHGTGHGVLNLGVEGERRRKPAPFDLDGHVETVNAVNSTVWGRVRSTTPGGRLKTCGEQDMDFRGEIREGATVELRGTGRMSMAEVTAHVVGELALHSGALDFAAAAIDPVGRLSYYGGDATVVSRFNETNSALTYASTFVGILDLKADMTLTVAADAVPFVFGGSLIADAAEPHTLTVVTADGSPLRLGGATASASAFIKAPIVCANGIVMSDYVWLQSALPEDVDVEDGTTLTYDYAGALASDITLGATNLRVTSEGVGDGAIIVPTGRRVIFSTQSLAADGSRSDDAATTRTYANPVILQGGTLEFDGAGTTRFNGAVSGSGTIAVTGSGTVVLADGQALEAGCRIDIGKGTLRVASGDALGAATIRIQNGRFGNADGVSITVPNPMVANLGGIDVLGADATVTLTGAVSHEAPITKWGEGTLVLGGTEPNAHAMHVCGGTLVLGKPSAIAGIVGCDSGCTVRVDADMAVLQSSASCVSLGGGTFDLNGHDVAVEQFDACLAGSLVTNGGAADATFTVLSTSNITAPLTLADGAGRLFIRKYDPCVWDLSDATLANSGLSATNGEVRLAAPRTVTTSYLRFTAGKSRPTGSYVNTGIQFSELTPMLNGEAVAWPEGTTATSAHPTSGGEMAANVVDGNVVTKWYSGQGLNMPVTITCGAPVTFDAYRFSTANDAAGRDPVSWKLEIGTEADGSVIWTILDEQADMMDVVPESRLTYTPAFSVVDRQVHAALPAGYALDVRGGARVVFADAGDRLTALTGDGHLVATGKVSPTLVTGSAFTGGISGEAPVSLVFGTAEIPGFFGDAVGTTFVNDGVAGSLTFADRGVCMTFAGLADGAAALGLALTGDTMLVAAGSGGTHTGPTTVGAGAMLLSSVGVCAKYIRFTPIKGSGGQTGRNIQFSELQLLVSNVHSPWPEGSVATSTGDSAFKDEGVQQLLDGSVDTKCFWGGDVAPVLIEMPATVYFDGYRWYTGNDSMTIRNPVSWRFEYSVDGESWTILDEQTDRETTTQTKTLAYTFSVMDGVAVAWDGLSDVSPVTVADGGTLYISGVEETCGGLSGAGTLRIENGTARLNTTADAVFSGAVNGVGVFAKTGSARQTLSGAVALDGTLVVEAGVLDLTGATLTGVTNIVLKGGTLVGTASVAGDLTVASQGGAYGAELAVAGVLKLEGALTLATGFAGSAVRGNAFTFASTDAASRALFLEATAVEDLPRAWRLNLSSGDRRLGWSVTPGGTAILIR